MVLGDRANDLEETNGVISSVVHVLWWAVCAVVAPLHYLPNPTRRPDLLRRRLKFMGVLIGALAMTPLTVAGAVSAPTRHEHQFASQGSVTAAVKAAENATKAPASAATELQALATGSESATTSCRSARLPKRMPRRKMSTTARSETRRAPRQWCWLATHAPRCGSTRWDTVATELKMRLVILAKDGVPGRHCFLPAQQQLGDHRGPLARMHRLAQLRNLNARIVETRRGGPRRRST